MAATHVFTAPHVTDEFRPDRTQVVILYSQSAVAFTLLGIVALIALVIVYFYPTIVAYNRRHTNKEALFVLNLLLGWSIIGWAVALTWAVKKVER